MRDMKNYYYNYYCVCLIVALICISVNNIVVGTTDGVEQKSRCEGKGHGYTNRISKGKCETIDQKACRKVGEQYVNNNGFLDSDKWPVSDRPTNHPRGCFFILGKGKHYRKTSYNNPNKKQIARRSGLLSKVSVQQGDDHDNHDDPVTIEDILRDIKFTDAPPSAFFQPICKEETCRICPEGTFSSTEDVKCVECPPGKYQGTPGQTSCKLCPENTYHTEKGAVGKKMCLSCQSGRYASKDRTHCDNGETLKHIDSIFKRLDKQKEEQNDLSIKNSRLWQRYKIRLKHDKLMQQRKSKDDKNEAKLCKEERDRAKQNTIIVPAIEINQEIEKIEDTTCIDTNRDELLKSFCSFTSDLDKLFKVQNIDKEAKSFWPNICCKERRDTTLEVCEDPSGKLNRGDIIPFALSSGGSYSRHNLYAEVTDTIKKNGYLHKGMIALIESLRELKDKRKIKQVVNSFFDEISLCGPRILNDPKNSENKLCELFIPYQHTMNRFYELIDNSYFSELKIQKATFLEVMETSFKTRQNRLGKNSGGLSAVMQSKPKPSSKEEEICNHGSKWTQQELKQKKETFCRGYNHVDLSNSNVKTIAIHFVEKDIIKKCTADEECMFSLKDGLRYDVIDHSCPAPLFTAEDISLQQIDMGTFGEKAGEKKEWVATVQLNTQSANGFLQSELKHCKSRNYLIGTKVTVKAYVDVDGCCEDIVNSAKCIKEKQCKLKELKNIHDEHYVKDVDVTGTVYGVEFEKDFRRQKRRRLLNTHQASC